MTLQQIKDFVAANPGASWRPEELLFRFDDSGVKAGHVTVLLTTPGIVTRRETFGPFPVSSLADNPALRTFLGDVRQAQAATIDGLRAEKASFQVEKDAAISAAVASVNAAKDEVITAKVATITERSERITELQATVAAKDARIKELQETITAKNATIEALRSEREGLRAMTKDGRRDLARRAAEAAAKAKVDADAKLAELEAEPG